MSIVHNYKYFYEMKGDVMGHGMKKKGNKKWPTPRQKVIHNPIPTSLFLFNFLKHVLFFALCMTNKITKKYIGMGKYDTRGRARR